ncbi:anti-sigma factor RsbA family regulatory protein [Actinokineospora bangkokensis]|uniref:Uncharacterized protein n=1 Tax=Actinokineospora bangkokensis TaxID=1193682 RepID=A0A1Q9LPU5_9PSEU|nr:anti-sigma factor RsbA family regulatory protein [Actinokineospora bangkokensis]OLR94067.1 hypothetical protein BJP25_13930 [Actinokineospora bangkokensis]
MSGAGFAHEAAIHRDDESYRALALGFLRAGVDAGATTVALLGAHGQDLLADALPPAVAVLDTRVLGRNPARLLPALRELVDAAPGPVHCFGDPVCPSRDGDVAEEAWLHDALLDQAFADDDLRLRCPVPADWADRAGRSHRELVDEAGTRPSPDYSPGTGREAFAEPLPEAAVRMSEDAVHFTLDDLPELRDLVTVRASAFGLPRERALDLTLASNEVVTNSIVHGGDRGTLRLWHDERTFTCEVTDSGHIRNPLVGRTAPIPSTQGGRGLWLANQVCDLVSVRSSPDTGTVVRLRVDR